MIKSPNSLSPITRNSFLYAFNPGGNQKLEWGLMLKLLQKRKFANGYGFGFDVGAIYKMDNGWKLGGMLKMQPLQ
jgi:hypothetical protein